jgi:hypothetical protein
LRQHKELAELEAGDDSPAPELGEVVLVPVADAFDARDLGHLPSDAHAHLAEEVSEVRRMLYRFIQSLNAESG